MTRLAGLLGAGGCGRGIMPLLREQLLGTDCECIFVDDGMAGTMVNGHRTLSFEEYCGSSQAKSIAIAVADPATRTALAARCSAAGLEFLSVAAANVVLMDEVEIGVGALLSPFVTITSNVRIGAHFHANLYSYVEHDCVIGDQVTFAPSVRCNGNVTIGDRAYVGAGAVIRQGKPGIPLKIGVDAVIGMGAVVLNDVPAGATVVGNPARVLHP